MAQGNPSCRLVSWSAASLNRGVQPATVELDASNENGLCDAAVSVKTAILAAWHSS